MTLADLSPWQRYDDIEQKYGLTPSGFNAMVIEQENRCAICSSTFTEMPFIDHDHKTGLVRGLLCRSCNCGLGFFKDEIKLLARAIVYLEDAAYNNIHSTTKMSAR